MPVNEGWFHVLNVSARNCSDLLSVKRKFLSSATSHWLYPGPIRILRPLLPNWPGVILSCGRKASVLNHRARVRWSLGRFGSPTTDARVELDPFRAASN